MITDKMIEDFISCVLIDDPSNIRHSDDIKDRLKQKGYEVEAPKTKLEEARCHYEEFMKEYGFDDETDLQIDKIKILYEQAIEEMIDKLICCGNCKLYHKIGIQPAICSDCNNYSKWKSKD
jgi:hypothetical protein